jgi:hypothetical protein
MKHYPIAPPDPVDAIRLRMEQMNITRADLVQYIGSQSRVSEYWETKTRVFAASLALAQFFVGSAVLEQDRALKNARWAFSAKETDCRGGSIPSENKKGSQTTA